MNSQFLRRCSRVPLVDLLAYDAVDNNRSVVGDYGPGEGDYGQLYSAAYAMSMIGGRANMWFMVRPFLAAFRFVVGIVENLIDLLLACMEPGKLCERGGADHCTSLDSSCCWSWAGTDL